MTKNVGNTDKIVRLVVALVIAVLLLLGKVAITSTLGIILAVVAVIFTATALMNSCPIYSITGLSTRKAKK